MAILSASLFALLLFSSSASASKEGIYYFGGFGSAGDEFNSANDVAVNSSGAGPANAGDIYVVDVSYGRIHRFDQDGNFISAWGSNVLTSPTNEVQRLNVSASGGTYKLSFESETTTDIPFDAGAFEVANALQALPAMGGLGSFNVNVSGSGPFTIGFAFGSLSATDLPQITVDTSLLTGSASTETTTQGSGQYEVCTVAKDCRPGTATGAANATGTTKNGVLNRPQAIAVDGDTGNVYVADRDNHRVNEYAGDGTFIRSFGFGVDASTPGSSYEVCPAADRCTFGLPGSGAGQIGNAPYYTSGVAVSPPDGSAATGTVFVTDPGNRRVNTYDLDGTDPSSFGSEAQFGEYQPRKVTVDSRGIVYLADSNNGGEIDRYDSANANGGGVKFLESIAAPPLLEGYSENATAGLAVDPDSDGAGTDEDILYVLRNPSSGNTVVQQFGPVNDPGLAAAPTATDDTHGSVTGFEEAQGLAFDGSTGHLVLLTGSNIGGLGYGSRVLVLGEAGAPTATIDPVTTVDAHSATFSGSIDANGGQVAYRFEYVDDAEFQANGFTNAERVPVSTAEAGHGENPVPVSDETPHHLVPGTLYHVRLIADYLFSPGHAVAGPVTFTTDAAPPTITGTAVTVDTTTATLRGAINPENQAVTNYHFSWGPTTGYGNATPTHTLPSGSEPVAVLEDLSGLSAGTTYHYQLVASNGTSTTTGSDQTFTTLAQKRGLGPKRGYEIVSHNPTGGVPIVPTVSEPDVSPDGNNVIFDVPQAIPGSVSPIADEIQCCWVYKSTRGSDGWKVTQTKISRDGHPWGVSLDLSRQITGTAIGLDPDDQNGDYDLYERQEDGSFVWISRDPRIPVGTPQTDPEGATTASSTLSAPIGGTDTPWTLSDDGSTVVFLSMRALLDVDPGGGGGFDGSLYKWQEGKLSFVSQRPDGSVASKVETSLASPGTKNATYKNSVSRDGSRVAWSASRNVPGAGETIYIQIDGQPTVEAVKETGVAPLSPPEPYNVEYHGADTELNRVFYTSSSRLTPDSGASATNDFFNFQSDLYVYDVAADKVRDLTPRLDGIDDPSVDPAMADRARVLGVSAVSDDGKRVYFVANAKYDVAPNPFGQLPVGGERNLYMAEIDGIDDPIKLRFVATFAPPNPDSFKDDQYAWQTERGGKMANSNPDGSVLSFASSENLTGQPTGNLRQLFSYDAEADTLECASCPSDGSLPLDEVNRYPTAGGGETYGWRFQRDEGELRWVSSRGTVFFDTVTPLVDADQNTTDDVYEFRGGDVRLISGGAGSNPSKIDNASVDGSTVVFTTAEPLAPQDEEPGIPKIYVAREGGGFPNPPKLPSCDINAGACEGAGTSAPDLPGAGSAEFSGPGNIDESAQDRCKKLARAAKKLAARAAKLRREARSASDPKRADAMRRQARRVGRQADKQAAATKRCRRNIGRETNTKGRAGR